MQVVARYFEDVQIGEELPVLQKNINLPRMMAYGAATWDFIRIHYDADYVREQGFDAPFVDGQMLGGFLAQHVQDWAGADAFRRIAELTPEPFCSRTYRLLATAEERGADLASALLALSEDVRETRRESIKRTATKRRAAMLVPTIAILAPVLILFVAAPLPYLITAWQ